MEFQNERVHVHDDVEMGFLLAGSNHVAVAANREFTVIPCEIGGSERGDGCLVV